MQLEKTRRKKVLVLWRAEAPAEGLSTGDEAGWRRGAASNLFCTRPKDNIARLAQDAKTSKIIKLLLAEEPQPFP